MSLLLHATVTIILISWVSFRQVTYVPREMYNVTLVTPAVAQSRPEKTAKPVVEPEPPAPTPVEEESKKDDEMPPPPEKPKKKPTPKKEVRKTVPTTEIQKTITPPEGAGADSTATPSTGEMSFDSGNFPFAHYIARMRQKIAATWQPPVGTMEEKTCRVYFRVHRNGSVSHVSVEESSGIFLFDQSCQRAVLQSSPLPPLPHEYDDEYLGVHFGFLYREAQ
jgi:colicin import membrane protein